MPTINIRDLRKFRYLPVKQVALKGADGNIYVFGELKDGSNFELTPVVTKTDNGSDKVVGYIAIIDAILTQNDFDTNKTYINYVITNTLKGVCVWFNYNAAINTAPEGESLIFRNYTDEAALNIETTCTATYSYNQTPELKLTIKSIMTINQATNLWLQENWNNYTWT